MYEHNETLRARRRCLRTCVVEWVSGKGGVERDSELPRDESKTRSFYLELALSLGAFVAAG